MAEVSTGKRSYLAMLLSTIIPGLGQVYLRKPLKALTLFLGVAVAGAIIYINSLPVNSWRDMANFDELKELWEARQSKKQPEQNPDGDEPTPENNQRKRDYLLYIRDGDLLFRIGLEFQNDLDNMERASVELHRAFQENKVLLTEHATVLTKEKGNRWLIENKYQTYSIKKEEDRLNVYTVKKLMFRPSWKFRVSGLVQGVLFWVYAIFDGWRGRRGGRIQLK